MRQGVPARPLYTLTSTTVDIQCFVDNYYYTLHPRGGATSVVSDRHSDDSPSQRCDSRFPRPMARCYISQEAA